MAAVGRTIGISAAAIAAAALGKGVTGGAFIWRLGNAPSTVQAVHLFRNLPGQAKNPWRV